jgi:hypothetical protein
MLEILVTPRRQNREPVIPTQQRHTFLLEAPNFFFRPFPPGSQGWFLLFSNDTGTLISDLFIPHPGLLPAGPWSIASYCPSLRRLLS